MLSVRQLLRKDLKIVKVANDVTISMSSVMMNVNELAHRENFIEEISEFLTAKEASFCFVMGATVDSSSGSLARNILIYPVTSKQAQFLSAKLQLHPELKLMKTEEGTVDDSFIMFHQGDASFSRKKILPIIKSIFRDQP